MQVEDEVIIDRGEMADNAEADRDRIRIVSSSPPSLPPSH